MKNIQLYYMSLVLVCNGQVLLQENKTSNATRSIVNVTHGTIVNVTHGTIGGNLAVGYSVANRYLTNSGVVWHGYVLPLLALTILCFNGLVIAVFTKQDRRCTSHILMSVVAMADILVILAPAPLYVYMFTFENYKEYISYPVCFVWDVLAVNFTTYSHIVAIWLKVALGSQRFICVCFPFAVNKWLTVRKTVAATFLICLLPLGLCIPRWIDNEIIPTVVPSKLLPDNTMLSCTRPQTQWAKDNSDVYATTWLVVYCFVRYILPVILLVIIDLGIIIKLRKHVEFSSQASIPSSNTDRQRSTEIGRLSGMIIFILTITILVDLPSYYPLTDWLMDVLGGEPFMPIDQRWFWFMILRRIRVFVYPLNFISYCVLSRDFRVTLRRVVCGADKGDMPNRNQISTISMHQTTRGMGTLSVTESQPTSLSDISSVTDIMSK